MHQNPQRRVSPHLEEDILIMLEGISGDNIKYLRLLKGHRECLCFVCVGCAKFIFCVSGQARREQLADI